MIAATGLTAACEGPALGKPALLTMSLECTPLDPAAGAAAAACGSAKRLLCSVHVEPSTAPAAIVLLRNGAPLPQRELVWKHLSGSLSLSQAQFSCWITHVSFEHSLVVARGLTYESDACMLLSDSLSMH
jgi:hypothetical protein